MNLLNWLTSIEYNSKVGFKMINRYKLTTEHGVSRIVYGKDVATVKNDFKLTIPGVELIRIQFYG